MKLDFNSINQDFMVLSEEISGEICYLVNPKKSSFPKWDKNNLHFRSSIWNSKGEAVSLSYKKFFNWDESVEVTNQPSSINHGKLEMIEKLDGSTLIVSKYKGNLIVRTRGTTSAYKLSNGYEIDYLRQRYEKAFSFLEEDRTYLYEWYSPFNKIILNYGVDPDIFLTGCILHSNYSLLSQNDLDIIANNFGVKRPKRYNYSSIEGMINSVQELKGQEGICVYFNKGQDIRKVKSSWYLALHKLKSELSSIEKVIDLFFVLGKPNYNDFYNYVLESFDFELAEQCKGQISTICDAYKEVLKIIEGMRKKVEEVKSLPRKEAAFIILSSYGKTNRSGMVFSILDNKDLETKDLKRLIFQIIK